MISYDTASNLLVELGVMEKKELNAIKEGFYKGRKNESRIYNIMNLGLAWRKMNASV